MKSVRFAPSSRSSALILSMAACCVLGLTAHAQTVVDSGFEAYSSDLSAGNYTGEGHAVSGTTLSDPIPGWTATGLSGIQNGNLSSLYPTLGNNDFAYNDAIAPFYQILAGSGSTVQAGTYTLTVELGQRNGAATAGAFFSLFTASGSSLGTQLATSGVVGATSDGSGTFSPYSTIPLVIAPGNPYIGDTLAIALGGGNNKGVDNDDFDNVSLDFVAIPEPSTYALVAGGMALLFGVARMRRLIS